MKKIAIIFGVVLSTLFVSCADSTYTGTLNIRDFHSDDIPIITTVDSLENLLGICDNRNESYYLRLHKDGTTDKEITFENISYWKKGLQYLAKGDSVQLGRINFKYPGVEYVLYHNSKRIDSKTTISEMKEYLGIENPISDFRFTVITMNGEYYFDGYTMLYSCNDREVPDMVSFYFDEEGKLLELDLGCDNGGILSNI
jgi:hypothetical protein